MSAATVVPTPLRERDAKIGFIPVLALAVGAMIGGGVFTLSGTAIDRAGPAALVSYAIAGLIMFFSALSFVAVAARSKTDESGYGAVTRLLGRPWRFLVMWGFYLNTLLVVAFLADSFGAYLHSYFLHAGGATVEGIVCIVLLVALNLGPAVWVGRAESWIVGIKIGLRKIAVRSPGKTRAYPIPASMMTTDWAAVVNDPQVHIVIELVGGTTLAKRMILAALKLGKPVITANKALLAERGKPVGLERVGCIGTGREKPRLRPGRILGAGG